VLGQGLWRNPLLFDVGAMQDALMERMLQGGSPTCDSSRGAMEAKAKKKVFSCAPLESVGITTVGDIWVPGRKAFVSTAHDLGRQLRRTGESLSKADAKSADHVLQQLILSIPKEWTALLKEAPAPVSRSDATRELVNSLPDHQRKLIDDVATLVDDITVADEVAEGSHPAVAHAGSDQEQVVHSEQMNEVRRWKLKMMRKVIAPAARVADVLRVARRRKEAALEQMELARADLNAATGYDSGAVSAAQLAEEEFRAANAVARRAESAIDTVDQDTKLADARAANKARLDGAGRWATPKSKVRPISLKGAAKNALAGIRGQDIAKRLIH
jgi:hypothetical protein